MSRFLLNVFLRFLTPAAFLVLLWFYMLRLRFNVYLSLGVAIFAAWKIAGQGKRNVGKFFDEAEDTGVSTATGLILRFSVPLLGSVAVAQLASRLDYALGAFSPTITGLLAGGATFFVAYAAIAIAPKLLRVVFVSGRKLITSSKARDGVRKTTGQPQPKKPKTDDGLLFGGIVLPYSAATDHFLAVGATGSGKTITVRLLLQGIDRYMRNNAGSHLVIYDSKGVYIPYLANIAKPALPIIDLNPFREGAFAWDISLCAEDSNAILDLATILLPEPKNAGDAKFFTDAPRNLMVGIIHAFQARVGNNWTFRDLILAMLNVDATRILLSDTVRGRQLIRSYLDGDERTSSNIRATIQSLMMRFEPVASAWHMASQAGRTIDLQEWSKSGTGYMVLGSQKTEDSVMETINRVLLDLLKKFWLEAPGRQDMPKHFLVMDELPSAGYQPAISPIMNEGREKGVSVILGFQDISDLYHIYKKDKAESMTAQASHKALLRMEGDVTPQWASRIVGESEQFEYTYGSSRSTDSNGNLSQSRSTTEQLTRKPVLMPSQFKTLPRVTEASGLTACFLSPLAGGVWQHHYAGKELFSSSAILRPADESMTPQKSLIPPLQDWTTEDLERLQLSAVMPGNHVSVWDDGDSPEPETPELKPPEPNPATPPESKPPKIRKRTADDLDE